MTDDQVQCLKEALAFMAESIRERETWRYIKSLNLRDIVRAYVDSEEGVRWRGNSEIEVLMK